MAFYVVMSFAGIDGRFGHDIGAWCVVGGGFYLLSGRGPPVHLFVWGRAALKIERLSRFDPIL